MGHRFPLVVSGIFLVYGLIPVVLQLITPNNFSDTELGWFGFILSTFFAPWGWLMVTAGSFLALQGWPVSGDVPPVFVQAIVIALVTALIYGFVWSLMITRRLPLIISGVVLAYGLIPIILDKLLVGDWPDVKTSWIGIVLSILFTPWLAFMFWAGSIFRRNGLPTDGDWWLTPTTLGAVILVVLIAAAFYMVVWILTKIVHRNK